MTSPNINSLDSKFCKRAEQASQHVETFFFLLSILICHNLLTAALTHFFSVIGVNRSCLIKWSPLIYFLKFDCQSINAHFKHTVCFISHKPIVKRTQSITDQKQTIISKPYGKFFSIQRWVWTLGSVSPWFDGVVVVFVRIRVWHDIYIHSFQIRVCTCPFLKVYICTSMCATPKTEPSDPYGKILSIQRWVWSQFYDGVAVVLLFKKQIGEMKPACKDHSSETRKVVFVGKWFT